MKLDTSSFFGKISLPKRYFEDYIVSEKYQYESEMFFSWFDNFCASELGEENQIQVINKMSQIRDEIKRNFEFIKKVFKYSEEANIKEAQIEFDEFMNGIEKELFIGTVDDCNKLIINDKPYYFGCRISSGHSFFRIRAVNQRMTEIEKNPYELFHIPITKRQYSNNERFSLSGFPSLYLSTMLPLAWQECGCPAMYYYSEFQYKAMLHDTFNKRDFEKELKFISLYSPSEIDLWGTTVKYNNFDAWLEIVANYLKSYPLVLACSFVNINGKTPYKQEYIIPQMLMQWVQRNYMKIKGITYFSCVDMTSITNGWCAYNVVMPANSPYVDNKYSEMLINTFNFSNPHLYKVPIMNKEQTKEDRIIIEDMLKEIEKFQIKYRTGGRIYEFIREITSILSCIVGAFDYSEDADVRLLLHYMTAIRNNYSNICKKDIDEMIGLENKEVYHDFAGMCKALKQLYDQIVIEDTNAIRKILNKYIDTTWNHLTSRTSLGIYGFDTDEFEELEKCLIENHLMYYCVKLNDDYKTVSMLKSIAASTGTKLDDFFECEIGDDDWIKENMHLIKHPFVVKQNNISIYSSEKLSYYESVAFGNKPEDIENLL